MEEDINEMVRRFGHCPITPSLFIGRAPEFATPVATVEDAVRIIRANGVAVVSSGSWELALAIVEHFSDRAWAGHKVLQAQQNELDRGFDLRGQRTE